MKNVVIVVTLDNQEAYRNEFQTDENTPEYLIADRAYQLALIFADTKLIATLGRRPHLHELIDILPRIDYTYSIG